MATPTSPTSLELEIVGEVTCVSFTEPAISHKDNIRAVGETLFDLLEKQPNILINFHGVTYLTSSMLGKLIRLHGKANAAGGQLALCGLDQDLTQIIRLTELDKILNIFPNMRIALASF